MTSLRKKKKRLLLLLLGLFTSRAGWVCDQPVGDRVGRCRTCNRLALGSGFTGQLPVGWVAASGEAETCQKPPKTAEKCEISPDPAKIQWDLAGSSKDFTKTNASSPKSCQESLDLVFWLPKFAKSCWKTRRKA